MTQSPNTNTTKWKPGQLAAINWPGGELIVSASAGTGKTSVIIERAWQLVTSGRANIDELLIVTFTDDAAEQLKARFRARLDQEMNALDSPELRVYLRDQLHRLDRAQISTIHSFCLRVVRENYFRLGISSDIAVLAPEQATLLRRQVLDRIFEERYADTGPFAARFRRLIERYGGRGVDEGLAGTILSIHAFLGSLAQPERWLEEVRRLADVYQRPDFSITQLKAWTLFKDLWLTRLQEADRQFAQLREKIAEHKNAKLVAYLDELRDVTQRQIRLFREQRLDAPASQLDQPLPKSPAVRKDSPEIEWWPPIKDDIDAVKKQLKEFSEQVAVMTGPDASAILTEHGEFLHTLIGLVEEFSRRMLSIKETAGHLEFDDLQRLALEVLTEKGTSLEPSEVALSYRSIFKYVLVDEYQDINELQDGIIRLMGRTDPNQPARSANLFMVGDVKQSIYRFRLAEPEIFQRLYRLAEPGAGSGLGRIDLPDNFRSRREVIDAVNAVFTPVLCGGELELEYDEGSRLVCAAGYPPPACDLQTEVHILERTLEPGDEETAEEGENAEMEIAEREAFVVARRVRRILDEKFSVTENGASRPAAPEDVVILLRSMRNVVGTYISMLRRMGLNAFCEQIEAFLEYPEIADIVSLLKVIANPFQDIPLATVLRSPLVGATLTDLANLRLADRGPLYSGLVRFVTDHPGDPEAAPFKKFLADLKRWRTTAGCCSVAELVQEIFLDTHYPDYVRASMPGEHGGENLDQFLELAWRFGEDGRSDLADFLNYLDLVAEQGTNLAGVRGGGGKGVRIQTVHGSKGLEYPIVILGGVGRKVNLQDTRGDILFDRELLVGLKNVDPAAMTREPTLPHAVIAQSIRNKSIAEELRLLYVAMTRAKEKLILVGSARIGLLAKNLEQFTAGAPLSPRQVAERDTPLAWISAALASGKDAAAFVSLLGSTSEASAPCGPFTVRVYPSAAQTQWSAGGELFSRVNPQVRKQLLELIEKTEKEPVSASPVIDDVVGQLTWQYPYRPLVTMPTSRSVSNIVEAVEGAAGPGGRLQNIGGYLEQTGQFTFLDQRTNLPIEKGKAWHAFLERIDLAQPISRENLERQLKTLVEQKALTIPQAKLIDLSKVLNFFKSKPGRIMLSCRDRLHRELPFSFALAARDLPVQPLDTDEPVLLSGVVDCLARTDDGFVIIDYKTNAITAADVDRMANHYKVQLQLYAKAISGITRTRVAAAWLYFTEPDSAVQVI